MAEDEKKGLSRRSFLKTAAIGAAAVAASTVGKSSQAAAATEGGNPIQLPKEYPVSLAAPLPKVDFPMTGSVVFAKACKAEGLAALFLSPGNYDVTHAITNEGIPTWSGRHEGSMAHACDGFIRLTGEVAACSGTEGPGFTNMICAIAEAHAARSPMLVLASNMQLVGEDAEQGLQMSSPYQQLTTEGIKKYGKRLVLLPRVHEYAAYAFRMLKSGVPRPVHLDFPKEVSQAKLRTAKDVVYFFDKSKYRTEAVAYPSPKQVEAAIALLKQAQRPMIVASTGVFYHKAWEPLQKFAEKMQIPVTESGPTRGQFSDAHSLSATCAPGSYPSADVVMLVGQYCMPMIGEFAFGPDTRYIRIDPEVEDIGRNLPIEIGIVSDEKAAMEAFLDVAPSMNHDSWLAEVKAAQKKFQDENEDFYQKGKSYSHAIHPAVIGKELHEFLTTKLPKEQTTIVAGGYGVARYVRRYIRAYRPAQIMNCAYHYAAIGPDVGFTVGAGAAVQSGITHQAPYKGTTVVCVTGDAGFGFTAMELETLARYRMPTVLIVWNNNAWGTWNAAHRGKRTEHVHLFQENLRYEKIAEALGGAGEYITKPEEFLPALERCYKLAGDNKIPVLLNCQADKEFWGDPKKYPPGFLGKIEPGCMAYYH
jgi:thiamine pyrophosphate-dependent acetolactate synthase large subunit-like protein